MTDLLNEFAVMVSKAAECADWLAGQGIGTDIIYRLGASIVGVCRAQIDGDYWQPAPEGAPMIVIPVSYSYGPCELDPIDLVAWQPNRPDQWYLRTGNGDALGSEAIDEAWIKDTPLLLHSTPLAWLQGGMAGACVIDWRTCLSFYLGNARRILADTGSLAVRIRRELMAEQEQPEIRTLEKSDAA